MHLPPLLDFLISKWSSFTSLIPIIIAVFKYKQLTKPLKIIFGFLVFSFVLIVVNVYCAYHSINNLAVFHFYAIFEFAFLLWFFSYYVDGIFKNAIIPLVGAFAIWSIVNFLFVQNGQLNTYTRSIEAMVIIIYCIAFLNKQTQTDLTHSWGSVSDNWITTSLLIFYASSFFIFVFSNYFLTLGDKIALYFWEVYSYILVLENLLFAVGFYKAKSNFIKKH